MASRRAVNRWTAIESSTAIIASTTATSGKENPGLRIPQKQSRLGNFA
jgi:hypothetical protein